MGGHHGLGINPGKPRHVRGFLLLVVDPVRWQAEGRVGGGGADQGRGDTTGVDGQVHAREGLALTHNHATQGDAVAAGLEIQVVPNMHRWRQKTDLLGKFAADPFDSGEQVALPVFVHQRDQAIAQLQPELIDRLQVIPGGLAIGGRRPGCCRGRRLDCGRIGRWRLAGNEPGAVAQHRGDAQKHHMRHAGNHTQHAHDGGGDAQDFGRDEHLCHDLAAEVFLLAHPRHHHGCGHRDQQAGNLCHQRVAHGQQHIGVGRLASTQAMLQHTDGEPAKDVDQQDQDTCHRVAADKFRRAVHGAKEVRFFGHLSPAPLGFFFVDQTGVQVGVHRHLFARHSVEGEAGRDFGNAFCALGHHHKIDHHQDGKHDQTDRKIPADQEVAKGLDHSAGGTGAGVALQQHHPGGGHVQRQPHQGGQQQDGREGRKIQRLEHIGRDHHHHQRHRNIQREKRVQHPRRQGQHHHRQNGHHQHGRGRALDQRPVAGKPVLQ